jgi:lysophospholipase L1-like esterase
VRRLPPIIEPSAGTHNARHKHARLGPWYHENGFQSGNRKLAMAYSSDSSFRLASNSRKRRLLALQIANQQQSPFNSAGVGSPFLRPPLRWSKLSPLVIPADEVVRIDVFQHDVATTRAAAAAQLEQPPVANSGEREPGIDFQPVKDLLAGKKPAVWVFAGDGLTLGARHTGGQRNYCEHFAEELRFGLGRHLDVVINTSSHAETSRSLLDDLEWRALRFQPAVVSVMIGVNDAVAGPEGRAEFRKNLEHIIACIRAEEAIPLLHTPPRIDLDRATTHADLRAYVRLIRDISSELDVPCVDHWAFWIDIATMEPVGKNWLAADGLNPTAAGHRAMADLLFRQLAIANEAALRAKTS